MPVGKPSLLPELTRLISKARRVLYAAASGELGSRDESMAAWVVAARLLERRATSQKDLSELTGQHPAGISRLLDDMDRRGLTARALDPLDQRRRLVTLTPAGRRWHRQLEPLVLRASENVLGVLDVTEQHHLRGLLRRIGEPRLVPARGESGSGPRRRPAQRRSESPGR
ncbi:MAG TPA: MarR family winged helix-turn-helix transcriptional regulator [Myxococcaceae bacterium]|nr:MarR family winged helix-turn-helix transcriptional regulator [Myxococcaceae bacterium]